MTRGGGDRVPHPVGPDIVKCMIFFNHMLDKIFHLCSCKIISVSLSYTYISC